MRDLPALQRVQPLEQCLVLLPGRDLGKRGVVDDFLEGLSFHLKVCPRIDLRRFHIHMS